MVYTYVIRGIKDKKYYTGTITDLRKRYLKKRMRRFLSLTGQASLEYFILLVTVSLVVIAANFLCFSRSPGQVNAEGKVRNIAEDYFNKMVQAILE